MMATVCAVPGCVAVAAKGPFCAAHRWTIDEEGRRRLSNAQTRDYLAGLVVEFRRRYRRLSRFLLDVERLPLPLPCLLDFQFHSPRATLLVAESVAARRLPALMAHELRHLARQVRRYRRRDAPGSALPAGGAEADGRFVPWDRVEQIRRPQDVTLPSRQLARLASASAPCPTCGREAGKLDWIYVASPAQTWATLSGYAGWLAVCTPCREQVAFYIDRQN